MSAKRLIRSLIFAGESAAVQPSPYVQLRIKQRHDKLLAELKRTRRDLECHSAVAAEPMRTWIADVLALSAEQSQAQKDSPSYGEWMFEQYRRLRSYFEGVAPESAEGSTTKCPHAVPRALALHLAQLMEIEAPERQHPGSDWRQWRLAFRWHAKELRKMESLIGEGKPLRFPHYQRSPDAPGYVRQEGECAIEVDADADADTDADIDTDADVLMQR